MTDPLPLDRALDLLADGAADVLGPLDLVILREAAEDLRAQAWQPIETAPKDGTEILIYWFYWYPGDESHTGGFEVASWEDNTWLTISEDVPDQLIRLWKPLDMPATELTSRSAEGAKG